MKIGNVSQTVLRRSILKQLHTTREEAVITPSVEEMCAGIEVDADRQVIFSNTTLYGDEKDLAVFAMAHVLNDIATRGAEPIGVNLSILLPPHAYESRLKAMVEHAERAAGAQNVQILNAKAEVSPVISKAVVTAVGVGAVEKGRLLQSKMAKADQDIVLTKWIGLEGMLRIVREKEEELSKRFVPVFMNQVKALEENLFAVKELKLAAEYGVSAMHQITGGGILAALWNLAESAELGMEVELKDISIKQETIEICEYFHLNPYQMTSAGSVLMIADNGKELAGQLEKIGVQAAVIGKMTEGNERVILSNSEKRYLDRPAQDELLKIYEQ